VTPDEARIRLQIYHDQQTPLDPSYARDLYRLAGWELTDGLKESPIELSEQQKADLLDAERYMFMRGDTE